MDIALKAWLNGARSYAKGVVLYRMFGKDEELKKIFSTGETEARKKRLIQAIDEIVNPKEPVNKLPEHVTRLQVQPSASAEDPTIANLKAQAIPLLKKRDAIHSKLLLIPSDEERGKAAHELLDLDDQVDEIYNQIRHFEKHKVLPEANLPFESITDPARWPARYETCGRYVRRYRKELDEDPADEKAKQLLEKYEAEQLYYAKKLGKWT
jgi:hypothetical protein